MSLWTSWKFWAAWAMIGGLIGLFAFGFTTDPKLVPSPLIGKPARSFDLQLLNGTQTVSLEDFRGKPLVLNFWASWCVECRSEASELEAFHQEHSAKGDAVVVGVAIQDTVDQAQAFAQRFGKTYLLGLDNEAGQIALDYGIYGVPETFIIDANGVIRTKQVGGVTRAWLDQQLEKLAQEG